MPLTQEEKEQVEAFAQRLHYLIQAMEEATSRASIFPMEKRIALAEEFKKTPMVDGGVDENGNVVRGGLPRVQESLPYVEYMETQVRYYMERNIPEEAPMLLGHANAGALALQQHIAYAYPRIDITILRRMTQLYQQAIKKRFGQASVPPENGFDAYKEENHIYNGCYDDDEGAHDTVFQPSDASRKLRRMITTDVFKNLSSSELLSNVFFVDDLDYVQSESPDELAAFEILCSKDTRQGKLYEVRWEGYRDAVDMDLEDLNDCALNGLWMSPLTA